MKTVIFFVMVSLCWTIEVEARVLYDGSQSKKTSPPCWSIGPQRVICKPGYDYDYPGMPVEPTNEYILEPTLPPLIILPVEGKAYGCDYFPIVEESQRMNLIVKFLSNKIIISYDLNRDNMQDVQHEYEILRSGSINPYPSYVWIDENGDGFPDIELFDVRGRGKCEDYKPMYQRERGFQDKSNKKPT